MRGFFAVAAMAVLLCACSSRSDRASQAAIQADTYLQQGDLRSALKSIREATQERDDVSDYWQLYARIEMAAGDTGGAYMAYQRILELDPGNGQVLMMLGRLGMALGRVDEVDRYADRILLTDSGNRNARVMKAAAALQHNDRATAKRYIDGLLAENAQDADALVLKARLLAASNDIPGAARLIEDTLKTGTDDPGGRLGFLRTLYAGAGDRANLLHTLERLAAQKGASNDVRLAYAAMLYEEGRTGPAGEAIAAAMQAAPDNIETASDILELWRDAGPGVPPAATLAANASSRSLEMKALAAQRANDLGRPDIALTILGPGVASAPASSANADARAAYAYALMLQGNIARAAAILTDVLAQDPGQPRALLAHARMAAARRDYMTAIADARRVVTDDPQNVTARILLAEYLAGSGQGDLAIAQLHEGAQAVPASTRMTARLAETLIAQGDKAGARDALTALVRAAPTSLRARQLQLRLCTTMGDAACTAQARTALAGSS